MINLYDYDRRFPQIIQMYAIIWYQIDISIIVEAEIILTLVIIAVIISFKKNPFYQSLQEAMCRNALQQ